MVLGSAISADMLATRGEIGLNEAAERVVAVPALARRYPAARIIYSADKTGRPMTPKNVRIVSEYPQWVKQVRDQS